MVVPDPPVVTFGELLRQLRSEAGLTQEDLAESARVSARSISDLERGVARTARKRTVQLLADALRLSGPAREQFEAVARGRAMPGRAGAGGAVVAPRMLPRDITSFTGRQQELQELMDAAIGAARSDDVVGIYAIGGMAGIGKTSLAIRAAYRMLPRFPDGQLFADLRGYTAGQAPAEPGEILDMFLRRLGVDAADLPVSTDERSGMLRDRLASKRVLMVLDNVAAESQVRPLLPGAGGSLVVITSRSSLSGLVEVDERISLDALLADEATILLARLIGRQRAAAEPEALRQVRDFCGRLPLALRIVGQILAVHAAWTVTRLAGTLTEERNRLDRLTAGDVQVRSAFMASYRQLPEGDALMFRLLGLHPGPEFDRLAAASLAGIDAAAAEPVLDRLAVAHLITETASGRFGMHDLLRLFARQTCEETDGEVAAHAAKARLLGHFCELACVLDTSLDPLKRPTVADAEAQAMTSVLPQRQALAIFEAERFNLLAVLGLAVEQNLHERVWQLGGSLVEPLLQLRKLDDLLAVSRTALLAARQAEDTAAEAKALRWLGTAHSSLRQFQDAIARYHEALAICRQTGDRDGEARVLYNLGGAHQEMGRLEDAIRWHKGALAVCREIGDWLGEGRVLNNLGFAHSELGFFAEAITCYYDALAIRRKSRDRLGEGRTLSNLGLAYSGMRQFEQAIICHTDALNIFRETGFRYGEGHALANLGQAHSYIRKFEQTIAYSQDALMIFREIGDHHEEGQVLSNLGTAYAALQQPDRAAACWRDAMKAMNEADDRGQAATLEQ